MMAVAEPTQALLLGLFLPDGGVGVVLDLVSQVCDVVLMNV